MRAGTSPPPPLPGSHLHVSEYVRHICVSRYYGQESTSEPLTRSERLWAQAVEDVEARHASIAGLSTSRDVAYSGAGTGSVAPPPAPAPYTSSSAAVGGASLAYSSTGGAYTTAYVSA